MSWPVKPPTFFRRVARLLSISSKRRRRLRSPRAVGEISFRGTADPRGGLRWWPVVARAGMPITFLGAQPTFARWAQINRCTGSPSPADSQGCSAYSGCADGVDVILCTKQGGRDEPGDASIAWPVLKRHTR